jgi:hypothetical protein
MAQPRELHEADLQVLFGAKDPNAAAIKRTYPDAVCVRNGYSSYRVLSDFGDAPRTLGTGTTRMDAWENAAKSEVAS